MSNTNTTTETGPIFTSEVSDPKLAAKLAADSKAQMDGLTKSSRTRRAPSKPAAKKAPAKPAAKPATKVEAPNEVKVDPKVEQAHRELREVAIRRAEFEKVVAAQDAHVATLRKAGVTWAVIGEDLGMSAIWLQRKYKGLGK